MYASNFGVDESKMMERLWGENFFDPATKKWTTKNTGSATCKRAFVQFCYEPIKQIINTCMNDQKDKLWPMLQKLGVTMKSDKKELMGKALMKSVMQTWLPASSALLEMMIFHLPSPSTAQRYRVENLYKGPLDDQYANAIRNCDPEGPLMLYVSILLIVKTGRILSHNPCRRTVSVWTQTPSTQSITTSAPSVMRRAAVTSEEKSTCPGESIRLIRYSFPLRSPL
ncbi:hypothetical protein Vadar_026977 [Vaccinium darrowii]|uniref:Uncharacterized protein n=1 Tax=Vaccinium darrowii TaxID=229202 RepID=A0ACB7Z6Y8_9ERIC|nr:hypothetical protein Vadar_026977 [Vaccinium darrowii]